MSAVMTGPRPAGPVGVGLAPGSSAHPAARERELPAQRPEAPNPQRPDPVVDDPDTEELDLAALLVARSRAPEDAGSSLLGRRARPGSALGPAEPGSSLTPRARPARRRAGPGPVGARPARSAGWPEHRGGGRAAGPASAAGGAAAAGDLGAGVRHREHEHLGGAAGAAADRDHGRGQPAAPAVLGPDRGRRHGLGAAGHGGLRRVPPRHRLPDGLVGRLHPQDGHLADQHRPVQPRRRRDRRLSVALPR